MAGFFQRPDLSDIQFKQLSGSTLTLSGETDFKGTLKSKGIEIDATITGATSGSTGHVLTFIDGKIKLYPANSGATGGDSSFNSARPTTRSGIPVVNVGGTTVKQFLEGYFFPAVPPVASIAGGGTRQFGNNAVVNLTYTATRRTNPLTSVTVAGSLIPAPYYTALPVNGSFSSGKTVTLATPNTNQTFSMNVQTASESVNDSTSVTFSHRRHWFGDTQDLIPFSPAATDTIVNSSTAEFASSKAKSAFNITLSNQFFYYVYPTSFGAAAFTVNGLANTDFSFKDFSHTNTNGFTTTFRMYRSNNILNGTFSIAVA